MARTDGRKEKELRPVKIYPYYLEYPQGSALIEMGKTRVICTAMIEEGVPRFMKGQGRGWLTAEYGMLPAATPERSVRTSSLARQDGRSHEIQRLIGRALRTVISLDRLGERTIWVDCDVMQADGGTRTAAITAGFVASVLALRKLVERGLMREIPVKEYIAAVSVGIVNGKPVLDLCYSEDSNADVDMNVVMTEGGKYVEVQGSAEKRPFDAVELKGLLSLAQFGIKRLIRIQRRVLQK